MNKKSGLEYFPLDVDFFQDEKIMFVSARFGTKGEAIAVRLMCKIYRQGYFVHWDDDAALLFAKSVGDGSQHSCVKDVVHELLKRGFFERSIFERFGILTSRGIQRRYVEASIRRKGVWMFEELLLVDVSERDNITVCRMDENISSQNVYILSQDADILKQSKVKESKVKESKDKTICSEPPACADAPSCTSFKTKPEQGAMDAVITLTLNDWTEYPIFEEQVKKWADLYPAVNVMQQLRNMRGWLEANPTKRKTKTGILRFVNAWLAKTQDRGGNGFPLSQDRVHRTLETKNEKNNRVLDDFFTKNAHLFTEGGAPDDGPGLEGLP